MQTFSKGASKEHIAVVRAVSALLLGLACGLPAQAAPLAAPSAAPVEAKAAPSAEAGKSTVPVTLETIVVTAQKRTEDSQKVPLSLTAVSGETIADRRLRTVKDLENLAPNVQLSRTTSIPTLYIRGVGGGGRQIGFDTRAGIYVDGVYVGAPAAVDSLLLDLDRAEILRGPQGTLFGQNSTSGALNLITQAPGSGAPATTSLSYGNRDSYRVTAAGDVPIADPRVQLRASGSFARRDGFTRNVLTGADFDDVRQDGGRLRLRLLPSDKLSVDLSADLSLQGTHNVAGEPRTSVFGNAPPDQPAPFRVDNNTPERDDARNAGVAGTVRYQHGRYGLSSISAARQTNRRWTADLDRSANDWFRFDYDDDIDFYSQELRLDSEVSEWRLRWLTGLYVLATNADSKRLSSVLPGITMAPGVLGTLQPGGEPQSTRPRIDSLDYAAFGSLAWGITERLSLDAGLRVTRTEKELDFDQLAQSGAALGIRTIENYHDRFGETSVDPALGLRYSLNEHSMTYLRYAHGTKSGGFNADLVVAPREIPERFKDERVDSLEAGIKSDLLDRRLRVNLAMFVADYRDYQITQFISMGTLTVPTVTNAGRVRTWGPELSLSAAPISGLSIDLDAAWLHAEYRKFENGDGTGTDFSGNRTEYAPKWDLSLATRYERQTPWTGASRAYVGVAANYRSDQYANESNASRFYLRSRTLVSAQLGLAQVAQHWQFGLFAENLLDKLYDETLQSGTFGTLSGYYGTPRTWGAEMRYEF
ncbi:MAG: TonB-dependent receptor [Panacagrimonas sp.]